MSTNAQLPAVVVISKLPRHGETKTRLARTLGKDLALALHRAFLEDELEALHDPERWQLYLCHDRPRTADDEALRDALCGHRARSLAPWAPDLPRELLATFRLLLEHHPRVVVASGDVPHIEPSIVASALAALDHADVVIGPGPDGGYYLIGLTAVHDLFTPIAMGHGPVEAATVALARRMGLRVSREASLTDFDEAQDLIALGTVAPRLAPRTRALIGTIARGEVALEPPTELQLEVTSRCNLACTTCLRTYTPLAPDATLGFEDYRRIVSDLPQLARITFQLNGESTLAPDLFDMIADASHRGITTILNTNGTLLDARRREQLLASGLHELRVSLLGATRETVRTMTGLDIFDTVCAHVAALVQERGHARSPALSLWMVATRLTLPELPALVQLAADLGASEVYVQRLVLDGHGMAVATESVHGEIARWETDLRDAEALATELGVALRASGRRPLRESFQRGPGDRPQTACWRPWRSVVVTASMQVLPCCIGSFTAPYSDVALGDLRAERWEDVWNGKRYRSIRRGLLQGPLWRCCEGCGERWSL